MATTPNTPPADPNAWAQMQQQLQQTLQHASMPPQDTGLIDPMLSHVQTVQNATPQQGSVQLPGMAPEAPVTPPATPFDPAILEMQQAELDAATARSERAAAEAQALRVQANQTQQQLQQLQEAMDAANRAERERIEDLPVPQSLIDAVGETEAAAITAVQNQQRRDAIERARREAQEYANQAVASALRNHGIDRPINELLNQTQSPGSAMTWEEQLDLACPLFKTTGRDPGFLRWAASTNDGIRSIQANLRTAITEKTYEGIQYIKKVVDRYHAEVSRMQPTDLSNAEPIPPVATHPAPAPSAMPNQPLTAQQVANAKARARMNVAPGFAPIRPT